MFWSRYTNGLLIFVTVFCPLVEFLRAGISKENKGRIVQTAHAIFRINLLDYRIERRFTRRSDSSLRETNTYQERVIFPDEPFAPLEFRVVGANQG